MAVIAYSMQPSMQPYNKEYYITSLESMYLVLER